MHHVNDQCICQDHAFTISHHELVFNVVVVYSQKGYVAVIICACGEKIMQTKVPPQAVTQHQIQTQPHQKQPTTYHLTILLDCIQTCLNHKIFKRIGIYICECVCYQYHVLLLYRPFKQTPCT